LVKGAMHGATAKEVPEPVGDASLDLLHAACALGRAAPMVFLPSVLSCTLNRCPMRAALLR
jgi:hypothetical protein